MHSADLSDFARGIVHGIDPSQQMEAGQSYAVDVAIEVYRNNYRGNLHDALAGVYPVIEQLVGEDFFRLVTRQYIAQHPSKSGNLNHYGENMADFLATFEPAQSLPYLPDIASLEWACHAAYFAEDATALNLESLARIPPERYADLILHIHPSCHLVQSDYPVVGIWHAHQPGANFDIGTGACCALVSRVKNAVLVSELSLADAAWLSQIRDGHTLMNATNTILECHEKFDLQTLLPGLLEKNVLTGFELQENSGN